MLQKALGTIFLLFFSLFVGFSQTKSKAKPKPRQNTQVITGSQTELQSKREALMKEISNAQILLNEAKASQKITLTELGALNRKLQLRQQLISTINQDLNNITVDINQTNKSITVLNQQLAKYKMDYARSIRYAYKNKESQNLMVFVFSAKSFNEMMRRMQYMKKFRQYRVLQANRIQKTQNELLGKISHLDKRKNQRSGLLVDQEKHKAAIENDAKEKELIAQELKGQVSDLSGQIAKAKAAAAQLDNAIRIQIQKEIALAKKKAEEEAKKRAAELARQQAAEQARIRAEAAEKQRVANEQQQELARKKAIEEEQRKAAELSRQAEIARKKAAEDAEKQRQKDLEDARQRREEAAAEEKRIADSKFREEQKRKNEERNKEIDRKKEEIRQKELAKHKQLAEKLEKEKELAEQKVQQYKSGGMVVTVNPNQGSVSSSTSPATATNTVEPVKERAAYKNMLPQEAQNLSNNFESNRGSLPWPVDRGVIVAPFGTYRHPIEKGVTMDNKGIDIGTTAAAPVKAIFGGVVTRIFSIPGMGMSVLVNHGSYYTLYSKLASVSVSEGTRLAARQIIGVAGKNDYGDNVVHLEVWKVNDNGSFNPVNPSSWIAPR
ncbi:MAG TPA: peptidoglycan DD-metalloendopeptidase family protein [Edaphocola sp.]|nr:peptidoglycan DD-metalloendopeptidase family protein [Edaphocola sp.]